MNIRKEAVADHQPIRTLHVSCFETDDEANLVDRLRSDGDGVISLVALDKSKIIGHVMFSKMSAPFKALGLAPIGVAVDWRNQGIAARLIQTAITQATQDGWEAIFVLGDPHYYERFGFSVAHAVNFQSEFAGQFFMVMALQCGKLPTTTGVIEYAPAFNQLS